MFMNYVKTDFYKFYHSQIVKIHLIIPIIAVICFVSYYTISPWSELKKKKNYDIYSSYFDSISF